MSKAMPFPDDADRNTAEIAALRHDIERAIDRETEHVNRIEALEKARLRAQTLLSGRDSFIVDQGLWRAFVEQFHRQGDRTASVSDGRELETK